MPSQQVLDWGAFIAAVAALATAVVSWLTLREMGRQRRSAYQPKFAIDDLHMVVLGAETSQGYIYPHRWVEPIGKSESLLDPPPVPSDDSPPPALSLRNVGLGAAVDVNLTFVFNVEQELERMNGALNVLSEEHQFQTKADRMHIAFNVGETPNPRIPSSVHPIQSQLASNHLAILPSHVGSDLHAVHLPLFYKEMLSAYLSVLFRRSPQKSFQAPPIVLRVEYQDLGGSHFHDQFSLSPVFMFGSLSRTHVQLRAARI